MHGFKCTVNYIEGKKWGSELSQNRKKTKKVDDLGIVIWIVEGRDYTALTRLFIKFCGNYLLKYSCLISSMASIGNVVLIWVHNISFHISPLTVIGNSQENDDTVRRYPRDHCRNEPPVKSVNGLGGSLELFSDQGPVFLVIRRHPRWCIRSSVTPSSSSSSNPNNTLFTSHTLAIVQRLRSLDARVDHWASRDNGCPVCSFVFIIE